VDASWWAEQANERVDVATWYADEFKREVHRDARMASSFATVQHDLVDTSRRRGRDEHAPSRAPSSTSPTAEGGGTPASDSEPRTSSTRKDVLASWKSGNTG
jgi:hypothetical protein